MTDAVDMEQVQLARKRALALIAAIFLAVSLFLRSRWPAGSVVHETMIWGGALLIAVAIAGRAWVSVHLGRRKRWVFVADGPHSVVRHPLYALSVLGTAGAAAQTASLVVAIVAVAAVFLVLDRTARREEADMAARFGAPYRDYLARTPRFLPKPSLWRASKGVPADRSLLETTLSDSSLFASAILIFMLLRWAHDANLIPVAYELP